MLNYRVKKSINIEAYEKNDIFPGERLILTFETSQSVLRNDIIETMVEKYIL